jgi:hypothetical protein
MDYQPHKPPCRKTGRARAGALIAQATLAMAGVILSMLLTANLTPAVATTTDAATTEKGAEPAAPSVMTSREAALAPDVVTVSGDVWDRLAQCESGGNWSINSGNGYYGGLQFSLSSWHAVGGTGYPHQASRETQIEMGERLLARQGWGAWPACARKIGLR